MNLDRLYDHTDPAYIAWIQSVVTRVRDMRSAIADEAQRRMKTGA